MLRRGDETVVETWRNYVRVPGHQRIEMDLSRANGVIRTRDSVFVVRDRRVAARGEDFDARMTVAFDLYSQDVRETLDELKDLGFLPGILRTNVWQGEPAHVLIATASDGQSRELWVEARRLLPVRLLQPGHDGRTLDVRFENYQPYRGAWLAERVDVRVGGRTVQLEELANVRTGFPLPQVVFEAGQWTRAFDLNTFSRARHADASDPSPSRHGTYRYPTGNQRSYGRTATAF
jgi:hypothetical protein